MRAELKVVFWLANHLEASEYVEEYARLIGEMLVGHEYVICRDEASIAREIPDADVFMGYRITPELLASAKRLKWMQFGSSGIDHTIFPELLASDITITTFSGVQTKAVAEHVIALMLALSRGLPAAFRQQSEHRFDRLDMASCNLELAGMTIGILGLGKIGLHIARLAKAFGMRVIGTKQTANGPLPNVDEVFPQEYSDQVIYNCDWLTLALPLTRDTGQLITAERIANMRDGAFIINVSRGAMLDHDALVDSLKSGKLRGAALDVLPEEPLPPDSPLWDCPHLIITPHTGCANPHYAKRGADIFRANLEAFLTGGQMVNEYDKERGY